MKNLDSSAQDELTYLVKQVGPVVLILFFGSLNESTCSVLKKSVEDCKNREACRFILHFKGVTEVHSASFRDFVALQSYIRKIASELNLSGLNKKIELNLLSEGIIRKEEIIEDPREFMAAFSRLEED